MTNLKQIFLRNTPLLDVRAPVEYEKGKFPSSTNIPLLDNEQRELVGTMYKRKGEQAAISLGWELATEEVKAERIHDWGEYIKANPEGYLYCARGGLRSRTTQNLLSEAGIDYPLVPGGYRAMRQFLLSTLEEISIKRELLIIGGRTGCGKTTILSALPGAIDLEGIANHKGSTFGGQLTPQPRQSSFEHSLAIEALKNDEKHHDHPLILENEGKLIGKLFVPIFLYERMQTAKVAVLEASMEERIDNIIEDYIGESVISNYTEIYGEENWSNVYEEEAKARLLKIKRRLGGEKCNDLSAQLSKAIKTLTFNGDKSGFRGFIETLLRDYYDPMYDYQSQNQKDRIVFRGTAKELQEWANT